MRRVFVALAILFVSTILFSACSPLSWKTKAGLQVLTNDVPATIFLDGKQLEKTPFINKELNPGEYTVQIQPEDPSLSSYQTRVTLRKGLLTVITWKLGTRPETSGGVIYEMEPLKNSQRSELSLISIPDAAIVNVDNQPKGFAPVLVEDISTGEHEYDVTLPSYETQKHTINVLPGHRMNITIKLAKLENIVATGSSQTVMPSPTLATSPLSASSSTSLSNTTVVPLPKVKIKKTGVFNNGKESLRVRDQAGSGGKELGFALTGNEYAYLNETVSNWHKIQFEGQVGWVSGQYAELLK